MSAPVANRFRGAAIAAAGLALVLGVWWAVSGRPPVDETPAPTVLVQFDKPEVVEIAITRPTDRIVLRRRGQDWALDGVGWRPRAAMVRRLVHQLHHLEARAPVVVEPERLGDYGLGDDAVLVEIMLDEGARHGLRVGGPNPTSVSYYVQRVPEGDVFVVAKAAVDDLRRPLEDFREDRIARFEADDVERLVVRLGPARLDVRRTGPRAWRSTLPRELDVGHDAVQVMLGRISALRALAFTADDPAEPALSRWGLGERADRIQVVLRDRPEVALRVGQVEPERTPAARYVLHEGDDAVYLVRDGFLESFDLSVAALRNRRLVDRHEWDLRSLRVARGDDAPLTLSRTPDGWRWPDGGTVSGATARRLAEQATGLEAVGFPDQPFLPRASALVTVVLDFEDGTTTRIAAYAPDDPGGELPETVREGTALARIDDHSQVYEIRVSMLEIVADLYREHAREQQRDAEKHLDSVDRQD